MTDLTKLFLIRAGLVIGGASLITIPWDRYFESEAVTSLLHGIGEAAFVALILELLVDARLKRRLVRETVHEVAPRILARLLPERVFEYIEEHLLRVNLVRPNWNITYWLSFVDDQKQYVKLVTESKYEMANKASSPHDFKAIYEVELPLVQGLGPTEITEVTVRNLLLPAGNNLVYHYPPGEGEDDQPKVEGDYLVFKKKFEIPAHTGHAARQFVFRSTEHFRVGSIVPFFAKYLVETTTFRVIYPSDGLRVIVDFPANEKSELTHEPGHPAGDDYYVFPKPILPGQGFTVRFPSR